MPTLTEMTKAEAIQLAYEHSWPEYTDGEVTCGHPGCEDHRVKGRLMIHTFSGFGGFGCDLPLTEVVGRIEEAQRVGWIDNLLRHDLAIVEYSGHVFCLDVPRPREVADVPSNDIDATGRCCCNGCIGMGPCDLELPEREDCEDGWHYATDFPTDVCPTCGDAA